MPPLPPLHSPLGLILCLSAGICSHRTIGACSWSSGLLPSLPFPLCYATREGGVMPRGREGEASPLQDIYRDLRVMISEKEKYQPLLASFVACVQPEFPQSGRSGLVMAKVAGCSC